MGSSMRVAPVLRSASVVVLLSALGAGCGGREPEAQARLAQALDAIQHGRLDEAARVLAAIRPGGWLRSTTAVAPLALRLRAQLALRTGAQEDTRALLAEYADRWGSLAPAGWARSRQALFERFADWQGHPALLYLKGLEAEAETPALAIREWRTLLRDYPQAAIAPAAQLRLGLLQQRLENPTWALADLANAAQAAPEVTDPEGNPVAVQALLATGQIHRDQRMDPAGARAAFEAVITRYPAAVLKADGGTVEASAAAMARVELAGLDDESAPALLESVLDAKPAGFISAARIGSVRFEARARLAELALARRDFEGAKRRWLEIARSAGDATAGAPAGPRRGYGFEAVDALADKLAARSAEAGLAALKEAADGARAKDLWAYASVRRVKLLARLGRDKEAREITAELDRRTPSLECDPDGTGLLLVPAREAKRTMGG